MKTHKRQVYILAFFFMGVLNQLFSQANANAALTMSANNASTISPLLGSQLNPAVLTIEKGQTSAAVSASRLHQTDISRLSAIAGIGFANSSIAVSGYSYGIEGFKNSSFSAIYNKQLSTNGWLGGSVSLNQHMNEEGRNKTAFNTSIGWSQVISSSFRYSLLAKDILPTDQSFDQPVFNGAGVLTLSKVLNLYSSIFVGSYFTVNSGLAYQASDHLRAHVSYSSRGAFLNGGIQIKISDTWSLDASINGHQRLGSTFGVSISYNPTSIVSR